jgi:glycosyl transferase family 25
MNSINDIKHAYYINLDSRPDRKIQVENELKSIGIAGERFKALQLDNGAIGCSMSHLKLIKTAKDLNLDHVLVVEDDIQFLNPDLFVKQINGFLKNHKDFDVVLLAGNNIPPYTAIDDTCIKVNKCQTTTGYLVKNHYYDILMHNIKNGIQKLMRNPTLHKEYAIDKYWFRLQMRDNWYLIIPLTVTQRENYSDIEKRPTNYTNLMLDLDKKAFFMNQNISKLKQNNF